jgi:hypothetical protein
MKEAGAYVLEVRYDYASGATVGPGISRKRFSRRCSPFGLKHIAKMTNAIH